MCRSERCSTVSGAEPGASTGTSNRRRVQRVRSYRLGWAVTAAPVATAAEGRAVYQRTIAQGTGNVGRTAVSGWDRAGPQGTVARRPDHRDEVTRRIADRH